MALKDSYGGRSDCWQEKNDPVFQFWIDKECIGYPFFSLLATDYTEDEKFRIEFPMGTVVITGPKALQFKDEFASNRATNLKADGKDIVSVEFILRINQQEDNEQTKE